jgi:hypothetical protein
MRKLGWPLLKARDHFALEGNFIKHSHTYARIYIPETDSAEQG